MSVLVQGNLSNVLDLKGEDLEISIGIDEAGRGPVLGPMVYACFFTVGGFEKILSQINVKDSKKLTKKKRGEIFNYFVSNKSKFGWASKIVSAKELSAKMLRRSTYNLNNISQDCAMSLIKQCVSKWKYSVKKVYVDTVGSPAKYEKKLKSIFPNLNITVSEKADSKFILVGAASICAKVIRDELLLKWNFPKSPDYSLSQTFNPEDFGSGYPSDPVTKKFLLSVYNPIFGFPDIVRFSWRTADSIICKNGYGVNWHKEVVDKSSNSKYAAKESDKSSSTLKSFKTKKKKDKKSRGALNKVEILLKKFHEYKVKHGITNVLDIENELKN